METYNLALMTKKIYDSHLYFFTMKTLGDVLEIKKSSSFFSVVKRLVKNGVLEKIERNKYVLQNTKMNDYEVANILYPPSYISFESALNYYGILSQFPYEVTSATVRKTMQKKFGGKLYSYKHIQKNLFWGYEKKENFLIASPEKALWDQMYLAAKGLAGFSPDEYDLSYIDMKRWNEYRSLYPKTHQMEKIINEFKKYNKI